MCNSFMATSLPSPSVHHPADALSLVCILFFRCLLDLLLFLLVLLLLLFIHTVLYFA